MSYKEIKDLRFKMYITDCDDMIDECEYGHYQVDLKDNMELEAKDKENQLWWLEEYSNSEYAEELLEERMTVYDGEKHIGNVSIYLLDKVKTIADFISKSEAKSGDAGVCACCIVNSTQFKKLVQNRRYACIEWINLFEEYKTEENEGLVLKKVLEFLKLNYKVTRVFSRPVAINLSEDERAIMRVDYHQVESTYYKVYGRYMVGYVRSYYNDHHDNIKHLNSIGAERLSKAFDSYNEKKARMQKIYSDNGMILVKNDFEGVMVTEV